MGNPTAVAGLHMQHLADEVMIYNEADGQAHALNPVAAAVLEQCTGEANRDQLVTLVGEVVDTPVDPDVIDLALLELEEAGLIEMAVKPAPISRRNLIRKMGAGAAAAAALPIVESVITPAAAGDLGSMPPRTPYPTTLIPTYPPTTLFPTYAPTTLTPTYAPTTLTPTYAPTTIPPQPPMSLPPMTPAPLPPMTLPPATVAPPP